MGCTYVHLGRSFILNSYHLHYLASSLDFNFGEKPSRSKSCLFLPLCSRILDRWILNLLVNDKSERIIEHE
jgi:hypothetical protein